MDAPGGSRSNTLGSRLRDNSICRILLQGACPRFGSSGCVVYTCPFGFCLDQWISSATTFANTETYNFRGFAYDGLVHRTNYTCLLHSNDLGLGVWSRYRFCNE